MTAEVSIFPSIESVADWKKGLQEWKPKTDEEAGKLLALISILNSKAGDAAKKAANERLARKCEDCDVLEFDGFNLKAVRKSTKIWNETPATIKAQEKVDTLTQKLKDAKTDLTAALEKAGYEESEPEFSHWLVQ